MIYCVYWLHLPWHTDIFTQGYVGITAYNRTKRRLTEHKTQRSNKHLAFVFDAYSERIMMSVVLVSDKRYCADVEIKLRPKKNIGWNIAAGGGIPPSWKGKKRSKADLEKRVASRLAGNGYDLSAAITASANKRRGTKHSPEVIAKMSAAKKGKPPNNKGKSYKHGPEQGRKISAALKGKPKTEAHRAALRQAQQARRMREQNA